MDIHYNDIPEPEDLHRHILGSISDAVFITDDGGRFTYVCPNVSHIFGYSSEEVLALGNIARLLEDNDPIPAELSEMREIRNIERVVTDKTGQEHALLVNLKRLSIQGGTVLHTMRDITERKQMEERLQEYQKVVDGLQEMIVVVDRDHRYLFANRAFLTYRGLTPDQIEGRLVSELLDKSVLEEVTAKLNQCLQGNIVEFELTYNYPRIGERDLFISYFPIEGSAGVDRVACVLQDVTESKRAARALQDSEEELRTLFSAMTDVIMVLDGEGRYLKIAPTNPANLYRPAEEVIGQSVHDILPKEDADKVVRQIRQALETGETIHYQYSLSIDAREVWFDARISPLTENSVFWIARDVTESKRLEDQLHHAQKMEAIGRLAGGIAHDFNNLMIVVTGYSELLLKALDADDPKREFVSEIWEAGQRSAALTHRLLAFSRKQVLKPKVLNINEVVLNTGKMLRRLIGEDVQLVMDLDPGSGNVVADPGQMEQVLLNLAVNARDAMPHGGRLTIRTGTVQLTESDTTELENLTAGSWVVLSVIDSGDGIAEEIMPNIFEPFFTTKGQSKGTGLGLSVVHGIIRQSEGHIRAGNEPDGGARFDIYLPRVSAEPEKPCVDCEVVPEACGGETILLVEDDDAVRALAGRILEKAGYQLLSASNGADALKIARAHTGCVDLLVTDVVMPGMGGQELAERLLVLNPAMKVLYISGYAEKAIFEFGKGCTEFLQKPFSPAYLARVVNEMLSR